MAGTNSTLNHLTLLKKDKKMPSIILVEPQLGVNIGMAARAMLNCNLTDLRLVSPRDGWPNDEAIAASADASIVIENTRVYQTTHDAIADLELVFASTARSRDMVKRTINPGEAISEISLFIKTGGKAGVLFGRESKGLKNNDVALADAILSIPLNPSFSSLNLAQAVYTIGYEWISQKKRGISLKKDFTKKIQPANKQDLIQMLEHLEQELDKSGFLRNQEKRPSMLRNLKNMFVRAQLTDQEVRTFRGVIKALASSQKSHTTN